MPVSRGEDANGNGVLDAGEDWDSDGRLDDDRAGYPKTSVDTNARRQARCLGRQQQRRHVLTSSRSLCSDFDGDGTRDGDNVDNFFVALWEGRGMLPIQLSMIGMLTAMVAISGSGGLTNTSISGYTRDQGWGMGKHVGAIPSAVGRKQFRLVARGHGVPGYARIARPLSAVVPPLHARSACRMDAGLLYRHCLAEHAVAGLSEARHVATSEWEVPGMTADGVVVSGRRPLGQSSASASLFWYLTLFCGSDHSLAERGNHCRRRASPLGRCVLDRKPLRLRKWKTDRIAWLYFGVLLPIRSSGLLHSPSNGRRR